MRSKFVAVTLLVLAQLILLQSARAFQNPDDEQQLAVRREHFTSGRQLLLDKGVPFDPDELLKGGWDKRLKTTLDSIPEMHQVRRHAGPLNGVQMADTLYLPEHVDLSGDTVIVAKYIVFEGTHPVIKGSHDLSVFPSQPMVVLGTTVAELMRKRPGLLNVSLKNGNHLPSFALLQDLRQGWKHITFDTSGPEPQPVRKTTPKVQPTIRGASFHLPLPFLIQSQDTSGTTGQTGTPGVTPPQSAPGVSPAKAANGSCAGTFNGKGGEPGGDGAPGLNGQTGGQGGPGGNAGNITVTVPDGDFTIYTFTANGGPGGLGGAGGNGGMGGNGGRGGDGGDGIACGCQVGDGGDAGRGGTGGIGGNGAQGGIGGTGGNGGSISVSLPAGSPGATTSNSGGPGGRGGDGGVGGIGGNAGLAGNPGAGAVACGNSGAVGDGNFGGDPGAGGNPAAPGAFGVSGAAGPPPSVTFRQASGGGGGGGLPPDPCLNGATVPGPTGDFVNNVCSPVIVDTTGNGFQLTSAADGVFFDIRGNGHPVRLGWTAAGSGNAFLALPGPNGLVSNGTQLFGNFTPQPDSPAPNGFAALAVYDQPDHGGNSDGVIDETDQIFSSLRLWIDANHDGVCQPEELHTLPEQGILAISLKYTESGRTDQYGNRFRFKAKVNPKLSGDTDVGRSAYDVFLTGK